MWRSLGLRSGWRVAPRCWHRTEAAHIIGDDALSKAPVAVLFLAIAVDIADSHQVLEPPTLFVRYDVISKNVNLAIALVAIDADQVVAD